MLDKLGQAFKKLKGEFEALESRVDSVAKVRAIVHNGKDGQRGDTGVDGINGRDGRDGIQGEIGAAGRNGIDGAQGIDGGIGETGAQGETGSQGVAGKNGVDGKDGRDGVDGKDGRDGVDGASLDGVEVVKNEIFTTINGKRRSAGRLDIPRLKNGPFTPGTGGAGWGAANKVDKFSPLDPEFRNQNFSASFDNDDYKVISIESNGFTSCSFNLINYDVGTMADGDFLGINQITVDGTNATGGAVTGMTVAAVNPENLGNIVGIAVLPGVGVYNQVLGTFVSQTVADVNAVDELTDLTTDGPPTVPIFVLNGDTVTIGASAEFGSIEIALDTMASQDIDMVFEYSTGVGTWATSTTFTDSTIGFQSSGIIWWGVGRLAGFAAGDVGGNFLIRLTRTRAPAGAGLAEADTMTVVSDFILQRDETGVDEFTSDVATNPPLGSGRIAPAGLRAGERWVDTDDNVVLWSPVAT